MTNMNPQNQKGQNFYSIRNQIILFLALSMFLIALIASFVTFQTQRLIREHRSALHTFHYTQIHFTHLVQSVDRSNLLLQMELINRDISGAASRRDIWKKRVQKSLDSLDIYKNRWSSRDMQLKYAYIVLNLKKLRKDQGFIEDALNRETNRDFFEEEGDPEDVEFMASVNPKVLYNQNQGIINLINIIDQEFSKFQELQDRNYILTQELLSQQKQRLWFISLIMLMLVIGGLLALGVLFAQKISDKFQQIQGFVWDFSQGNIPRQIPNPRDETREIFKGFKELSENLMKIKNFAKTVSHRELDREIDIFNSQGELGQSLIEMNDGLQAVATRDRQRNWTNEGIALFSNLLREYSDAQPLYDALISNLVKYLGANQGGIFVLNDRDEYDPTLDLQSVYAYERKRFVEKSLRPGQGLVGQAWLEKDVIYLKQAAQEYIQIVSGLGGASPRSVLICPMIDNESKVLGALELASFKPLEKFEIEFIRRVSEMIVSAISSLKNNEKNRILLEEAQKVTNQMRIQEAKMRDNLKTLMTTQEETRRNQAELRGQTEGINTTLATLEIDLKGNIIQANDIFINSVKYQKEELIGRPYSLLVEDRELNSSSYQQFWQDLMGGTTQHLEVRRKNKFGEYVWFNATFTLIRDIHNEPHKILKLAMDVTDQKKLSINYRSQLEAINKSTPLIVYDTRGFILDANELYLRLMGYKIEELRGQHHSMFISEEEKESSNYGEFWAKLAKGDYISGKFKRVTKTGRVVWIRGTYNPIADLKGKMYKVMKLAQDITHEVEVEEEVSETTENLEKQQSLLKDSQLRLKDQAILLKQSTDRIAYLEHEQERNEFELRGYLLATNTTLATAEFALDGIIMKANEILLNLTKYDLSEIRGLPHSIFEEKEYADSEEYDKFWSDLRLGISKQGKYKFIARDTNEIWLNGSFTSVKDAEGKPYKIIFLGYISAASRRRSVNTND